MTKNPLSKLYGECLVDRAGSLEARGKDLLMSEVRERAFAEFLRRHNDTLVALVATLPKCARGCRRLATTTDGDGTYHCDPHRPPRELTVSVDLPWAKLVREEKIPVQP